MLLGVSITSLLKLKDLSVAAPTGAALLIYGGRKPDWADNVGQKLQCWGSE